MVTVLRNCRAVVSARHEGGLHFTVLQSCAVAKAIFLALDTNQTRTNKFKKANQTTDSVFVASSAPKQVYNSLKTASFLGHVGIIFRSQFLLRYGETNTQDGFTREITLG